MARERDESKRSAILEVSKQLFARKGYHGTSISDIVNELGIPAGSIYTYFKSKDHILITAIEEGWEEFMSSLESACRTETEPERKLSLIIKYFLPQLFKDTELITLILTEGVRFIDLNDKLNRLSRFISGILADLAKKQKADLTLSGGEMTAALTIFFLGSIDTMRLINAGVIPIKAANVTGFIQTMIESAFRIQL